MEIRPPPARTKIGALACYDLETAGETVQKLESPGLSRRGDGTVSGTSSSTNIFIKVKVHLK